MKPVSLGIIPKEVFRLQRQVTPNIIREVARQTDRDYSDVKADIEELRNPQAPLARLVALHLEKSN